MFIINEWLVKPKERERERERMKRPSDAERLRVVE